MGTSERSDHISTNLVLFKVGLKVPTPKHEVVAAEGTAKGGRIGEDLLHYAVFIRAYTACTKHCCVCSGGDCRIAVETSAFSNKAFSWNKGYFVTNVVAVEHGRYSLPCMQKL